MHTHTHTHTHTVTYHANHHTARIKINFQHTGTKPHNTTNNTNKKSTTYKKRQQEGMQVGRNPRSLPTWPWSSHRTRPRQRGRCRRWPEWPGGCAARSAVGCCRPSALRRPWRPTWTRSLSAPSASGGQTWSPCGSHRPSQHLHPNVSVITYVRSRDHCKNRCN